MVRSPGPVKPLDLDREARAEDAVENPRDRPTMQDIADKVGVSKALVSLVFRKAPGPSDETRRRVFAAADELGYRVNRTAALMTARRSHLIGVMADIRNSFHAEMVEDIVEAADKAGYEVVLGAVTPTHGESKVIDTLLDFRCEGVVLLGPESTADELTALGERLPTVVVGRRVSAAITGRRPGGGWSWDGRGGRSSRRPGTPPDRACVGRIRPDRGGPAQRLSARDATARLERRGGHRRRVHRERGYRPRRRTCYRRICRPRWSAPTTASPSAYSTDCAGPASRCPGRFR